MSSILLRGLLVTLISTGFLLYGADRMLSVGVTNWNDVYVIIAGIVFMLSGSLILREWTIVRKNPETATIAIIPGPLDHMRFCPSCGKAFVPPASSCVNCGLSLRGIA